MMIEVELAELLLFFGIFVCVLYVYVYYVYVCDTILEYELWVTLILIGGLIIRLIQVISPSTQAL